MVTDVLIIYMGMVLSRICSFEKTVHNEPAAAVADKAHWTGRQHKIIITGHVTQQL